MKKEVLYTYLGTNGTLTTPIHLEDIYYIRKIQLTAGYGKRLTNGEQTVYSIIVPEEEVNDWKEISV